MSHETPLLGNKPGPDSTTAEIAADHLISHFSQADRERVEAALEAGDMEAFFRETKMAPEQAEEYLATLRAGISQIRGLAESRYKDMGLEVIYAKDQPDKVYEPHSHHATRLFSLSGSVKVRVGESDWREIRPGEEVVIEEGEEHEAITGPEGWEYIFAYPAGIEPFSSES